MSSQPGSGRTTNPAGDLGPPAGTAIVRPLRHVIAVRERHLQQLAERSLGGGSRSAQAWSWALGETDFSPVTGRMTAVPPGRAEVLAEIAEADARRLDGRSEDRADGAAAVLRWLIGDDDHLPVRGPDRGALTGGFGEVVRSPDDIAQMIASPADPEFPVNRSGSGQEAGCPDYWRGVLTTANWILGRRVTAPLTGTRSPELTSHDLKTERLHAYDQVEQPGYSGHEDRQRSGEYATGVIRAIDWLLGGPAPLRPGRQDLILPV